MKRSQRLTLWTRVRKQSSNYKRLCQLLFQQSPLLAERLRSVCQNHSQALTLVSISSSALVFLVHHRLLALLNGRQVLAATRVLPAVWEIHTLVLHWNHSSSTQQLAWGLEFNSKLKQLLPATRIVDVQRRINNQKFQSIKMKNSNYSQLLFKFLRFCIVSSIFYL